MSATQDPAAAPSATALDPAPGRQDPGPAIEAAPAMVVLDRVGKRFGERVALEDVSFAVAPGQVVALLGANGSGKSTCLRVISGFLDPDAGSVRVAGLATTQERLAARAHIGYMPESVPLYQDMRVAAQLVFHARLHGLSRRQARARMDQVTSDCGLADVRTRIIGHLSKGYRQRVGLAQALIAEPSVLLLDEPTSGLDPLQVREFRALIQRQARARTVIISSHVLSEMQALADRLLVLARGRLVGDGTLDELRAAIDAPADAPLEDIFVALTRTDTEGDRARATVSGDR